MKAVYFLTCLIVSVKSDCRTTAEMEGQWVSGIWRGTVWRMEIGGSSQRGTCRFHSTKGPTEPRKYTPVQSAELGIFFPSSRVTAWSKQRESHGWIHAKCRRAWAAGENWV